jgi:hypothetical protein
MKLESVRAALWDVRAQWESGLRRVTAVQHSVERLQATAGDPDGRPAARLHQQVDALKEINATVRHLLQQVERALE